MKNFACLTALSILVFCSAKAEAQNKYFEDFQDTVLEAPETHQRRIEYYGTYRDNRSELDARRRAFESGHQDALREHDRARSQDDAMIDYDAGTSAFPAR